MKEKTFNLAQYFLGEDRIETAGNRVAIIFRKCSIAYKQLRAEALYWQKRMVDEGIGSGDRVALLLYDSPEFIACFLAAVGLGAIAVPINTFLPSSDIEFILGDCQARLTIVEDELKDKIGLSGIGAKGSGKAITITRPAGEWEPRGEYIDQAFVSVNSDERTPAFLLYTSGSTGMPKGVLHLHGSIPFTVDSYSKNILKLGPDDRVFSASRLFFAYGLGNSLSFPLAAGSTVILDTQRPTPPTIAAILEQYRPTVFFGVPAAYNSILEYRNNGGRVDTSSLRLCISAGEALPGRVLKEWENVFGLTILDGIGSTEMLHIFLSNAEGDVMAGSSGKVVSGYDAKLVDDEWNEVESGEPGNLWVKGGSATSGYWGREDLTESIMKDGWVRTGDIYRIDADSYFYHVGRSDDCFKVSGMWVSPLEVESVLLRQEGVREAAVVSGKGEEGLATVNAFVVIRDDVEKGYVRAALFELLRAELPRYKVPSRIEFLDDLPRTSTGKVQRFRLRSK